MIDLQYLFKDREPEKTTARQTAITVLSGGDALYGRILLPAAGSSGQTPVVLMLHGFPGHEQNRDLAQALRRIGFAVVTFSYRGNWGSGGVYRLGNLGKDAEAVISYLQREGEALGLDTQSVFTVSHSMGGFTTMQILATGIRTRGSVLLAPCDIESMYLDSRDSFDTLIGSASVYLHLGVEGASVFAQECETHRSDWRFIDMVHNVHPQISLLLIGAGHDTVTPPRLHIDPLLASLKGRGFQLSYQEFPDIHTFHSCRIRLIVAVSSWLAERC